MALDPLVPPIDLDFIGQLTIELPADVWVPSGFSLVPQPLAGGVMPPAFSVADPEGRQRTIYALPDYRPASRSPTIARFIVDELGPFEPRQFLTPEGRELFGVDQRTPLGAINDLFFTTDDLGMMAFDLAGYGEARAGSIVATV